MGGHWTLHDIVDCEMTATMALLDTMADRRETLLRQIYEINKVTVEGGRTSDPAAILIPNDHQHDPHEVAHLVDRLQLGGVDVYRAGASFEADGKPYPAGTFVIPMSQIFARYAKDMLEPQTYPEVRRAPNAPPEPPYDVTAWSLGMLLGVDHVMVRKPLAAGIDLKKLDAAPSVTGKVTGNGPRFVFDYRGADAAKAINALLKDGAKITLGSTRSPDGRDARVWVTGVSRPSLEKVAAELGFEILSTDTAPPAGAIAVSAPRIAMYQPWTGGNMDEGWTRWVLEQYGFSNTPIHNADIKAGKLRDRFDVIILADQAPRQIIDGANGAAIRPEFRGGIGEEGVAALHEFVSRGGTLITLGAASDLAIDRFGVPVKDIKEGLSRDQHFAPGTIARVDVDTANPLGFGLPPETYSFYNNSPFFSVMEGFSSQKLSVVARYPNTNIVASGWLKGEDFMAGRAAVVMLDLNPGRIILYGLRPQHRAQTHATFPLLFNALYLATK